MNRRKFLAGTALGGVAAALAACATTTVGPVTTVTLDVRQMNAWGQAFVNAASYVALLPGIVNTPFSVAIAAVGPLIAADMTAFNNAAGGALVFTYDRTTPATVVTSLAADVQTLLTDVTTAVKQIPQTMVDAANQYLAAIKTLVSLFQAAMSSKVGAVETPMTEAQALAVLNR